MRPPLTAERARGWIGPVPLVCALALIAAPVLAQEEGPPAAAPAETLAPDRLVPVLTLDQDRMFRESAWGADAVRRAEAAAAALSAENRGIEQDLEQEERALTEKRAQMTPQEFAPLARAFDERVEEFRQSQDAKSRAISRRLDEDRQRFRELAVPVLVELLGDHGAVVIIADDAVILSLTSADVTDEAVELMDLRLPAPEPEPPAADPAAAPGPAPGEAVAEDPAPGQPAP
ncbi:OmpH family outer membrane protein [Pseudogemmobacter humi]|uniref:Outer membrane protein (OmpH-like) n=1 Tax=Pseudogemmobacter humi TaxID=2483812 RepID=A0A3P5XRR2_9RHOB|nr:OmpH family outer membrane protein [Pseudogemmobacter humi]VDC31589.1 Outer membrane protein (OmpH-like) [Pseudogemmobacter humi]